MIFAPGPCPSMIAKVATSPPVIIDVSGEGICSLLVVPGHERGDLVIYSDYDVREKSLTRKITTNDHRGSSEQRACQGIVRTRMVLYSRRCTSGRPLMHSITFPRQNAIYWVCTQ